MEVRPITREPIPRELGVEYPYRPTLSVFADGLVARNRVPPEVQQPVAILICRTADVRFVLREQIP
jgi:hypothetical protein